MSGEGGGKQRTAGNLRVMLHDSRSPEASSLNLIDKGHEETVLMCKMPRFKSLISSLLGDKFSDFIRSPNIDKEYNYTRESTVCSVRNLQMLFSPGLMEGKQLSFLRGG